MNVCFPCGDKLRRATDRHKRKENLFISQQILPWLERPLNKRDAFPPKKLFIMIAFRRRFSGLLSKCEKKCNRIK